MVGRIFFRIILFNTGSFREFFNNKNNSFKNRLF